MITTPKKSILPLILSPTTSTRHSVQLSDSHRTENKIRHFTQKLHRNLSLLNKSTPLINPLSITFSHILNSIKTPLTTRSLTDISILHYFLSKTSLLSKFKDDNIDILNYDKMLIIISTYATYLKVLGNELIYNYNHTAKYCYVILQGEITLYTPYSEIREITGYEYFCILIQMFDNDELSLLEKTIACNKCVYDINYEDIDLLKLVMLKISYQNLKNKYDVKKCFFERITIKPSDVGIDFEKMGRIAINDKIEVLINNVDDALCEKYLFLNDNNIKNKVSIYTYRNKVKICKEGDFIGKSNNDIHIDKAVAKTETHLITINNYIYNDYLAKEKENLKSKEVSFLYDNFFFKSIVKRKFEREYFPLFTKETFKKHDIIYQENDHLNYIYFIQEGSIILSLNKSIIDTYLMIKHLQTYNNINDEVIYNNKDLPYLSNLPSQMANELTHIQKRKIFILNHNEVLGIESLYGELNYLFTAKASSEICLVYKIKINDLLSIFDKEELIVYEEYSKRSKLNLETIYKRLIDVNKSSLQIIDRQLCIYNSLSNANEPKLMYSNKNKTTLNNKNIKDQKLSVVKLSPKKIYNYKSKHSLNIYIKQSNSNTNIKPKYINTFRDKKLTKIFSLNDVKTDRCNSKNNFEERMLIKAKRGLHLNRKQLISQLDSFSQPSQIIDNIETTNPILTSINSKQNIKICKNSENCKKAFSLSQERKSHTTTENVLNNSYIFRSPITKEKIKKYSIFDNGLDYFEIEGNLKHFKQKRKQNERHDNNDDINKTFKHINTLSLKKIDENINRKRYNIQLRQVSAINLLKQTKNNTYRHLIRKHMHHKLDPIETNK